MKKLAVVFLLLLSLSLGCAATGPKYKDYQSTISGPPEGYARIFFFRNSRFMSSGVDAVIEINKKKVGECGNGAYFFVDLADMKLDIIATSKGGIGLDKLEKNVEPGIEYFFEMLVDENFVNAGVILGVIGQTAYSVANNNTGGWIFAERNKDEALKDLEQLTYSLDGE
jgi:hypothetical protein